MRSGPAFVFAEFAFDVGVDVWISPDTRRPLRPAIICCLRFAALKNWWVMLLRAPNAQSRLLSRGSLSAYVGVDVSGKALRLLRQACRRRRRSNRAEGSGSRCIHERSGRCWFLRSDCRLLWRRLPQLRCGAVLLVAGVDDVLSRSATDVASAEAPCEEELLLLLHSAANALALGGRLLIIEPALVLRSGVADKEASSGQEGQVR